MTLLALAASASRPRWPVILTAVQMAVLGAVLLAYAPRIREHFVRSHARQPAWLARFSPAPASILMIRVVGLVCLLVFLFCLYALYFGDWTFTP